MGAFDYPTVDVIREVIIDRCEYTNPVDGTKIADTAEDLAKAIDQALRRKGYLR